MALGADSGSSVPAAGMAPWFERLSRPILFLVISLALAGAYCAFSIPVSVFPNTDFPRVVIGVDNGVTPIDQMLVTITRPIEEAVNSVPGLQRVLSTTSRGSAEVDLFLIGRATWSSRFSGWTLSLRDCKVNCRQRPSSKRTGSHSRVFRFLVTALRLKRFRKTSCGKSPRMTSSRASTVWMALLPF